jgi:hypothetical protein
MIIRSSVDVCPTSIASQIFSPSKRSSSSIKVYQSFNPFSLHTLCLPEPCPIETSSDAVLQAAQSCWSAGCWCWEVCNPLACFKRLTFVGKTRYLLAGAVGKKHRNSAGNKCLPFPNFPKYVQHLKSHILVLSTPMIGWLLLKIDFARLALGKAPWLWAPTWAAPLGEEKTALQ